jgi:hypothetical protein
MDLHRALLATEFSLRFSDDEDGKPLDAALIL